MFVEIVCGGFLLCKIKQEKGDEIIRHVNHKQKRTIVRDSENEEEFEVMTLSCNIYIPISVLSTKRRNTK